MQQQLDCCITANDQNTWEIISPQMSTTMLGTTHEKISITNTMTFSIFWFSWIYWVAVDRLTGFDKGIKVV